MKKGLDILKLLKLILTFAPRFLKTIDNEWEKEQGWHKIEFWVYVELDEITRVADVKKIHGLKPESEGYDVTREL